MSKVLLTTNLPVTGTATPAACSELPRSLRFQVDPAPIYMNFEA